MYGTTHPTARPAPSRSRRGIALVLAASTLAGAVAIAADTLRPGSPSTFAIDLETPTVAAPMPDVTPTTGAPAVTRWRLTVAQREHVAWAYERFRAAGLEPPSSAIIFTPDSEQCGGFAGRFRTSRNLVQVCARDDIGESTLRWLLIHELGHAWEHANLDDADRDRFQRHRGAPTWGSTDFPWTERATEHAAETIAWGLFDQPLVVQSGGDTSPEGLRDAFVLLTGTTPVNDGWFPATDPTTPSAKTAQQVF